MLQSFKINVRDYFIKYAKQSNYNVKHKIKIIEDRIDYIENLPSSEININEKTELEQELDSIHIKRSTNKIKSKVDKWRRTKYQFLSRIGKETPNK